MICMEFGLAFWFFLWGYVKALLYLPVVPCVLVSQLRYFISTNISNSSATHGTRAGFGLIAYAME